MTRKTLRSVTLVAAALAVLFFLATQLHTQQQRVSAEDESAEFAARVIALCQGSDPESMRRLVEAGVCERAHQIQTTRGTAGEVGPQGIPGRDGADGRDGRDGTDGRDGVDGQDGAAVTGEPGTDGEPGTNGARGERGPTGEPGQRGEPGPAGDRGPAGEPGASGADGRTPAQMTCTRTEPLGDEYVCTVTSYEEN